MTDELDLRRRAERRADMKLAFRANLISYVVVNAGLFAIDWLTSPGIQWAYWPAIGWGIGLAAHFATVYLDMEGSRERMIEAEMRRMRERG